MGRKKMQLPIEEIIKLYENSVKTSDIAIQYNISLCSVYKTINTYYKQGNMVKPRKVRQNKLIDNIIFQYENDISIEKIAEQYRLTKDTINKKINEYYKKAGKKRPKKASKHLYSYINIPIDELTALYEKGMTTTELEKYYQVSHGTIINRLKELSINQGQKRKSKQYISLPIDDIVLLYQNSVSVKEIAEQYHVKVGIIYDRIKNYYSETGQQRPKIISGKVPKRDTEDALIHSKYNQQKIDILAQFRNQLLAIKEQKVLKK